MFDEESEKTKQNLKSPKHTNERFSFSFLVLDRCSHMSAAQERLIY